MDIVSRQQNVLCVKYNNSNKIQSQDPMYILETHILISLSYDCISRIQLCLLSRSITELEQIMLVTVKCYGMHE